VHSFQALPWSQSPREHRIIAVSSDQPPHAAAARLRYPASRQIPSVLLYRLPALRSLQTIWCARRCENTCFLRAGNVHDRVLARGRRAEGGGCDVLCSDRWSQHRDSELPASEDQRFDERFCPRCSDLCRFRVPLPREPGIYILRTMST
jgi:hypothetical protein